MAYEVSKLVTFKTKEITSAHEFLSALHLSNKAWWILHDSNVPIPDNEWRRGWIFRGQASAKWSLLPRAWRNMGDETAKAIHQLKQQFVNDTAYDDEVRKRVEYVYFSEPLRERQLSPEEAEQTRERKIEAVRQALAEFSLIHEFAELADELGFTIAPLLAEARGMDFVSYYVDLYFSSRVRDWGVVDDYTHPNERHREFWGNPVIALAQHHGIPTRLLDWTRNPSTAAFFAAKDVMSTGSDDMIVVYALHRKMLHEHIRCVEVPTSSSDFLRAQAGLFTIDLSGERFLVNYGHFPSLEESLKHTQRNYKDYFSPLKLMLPVSEAPELMRLLWLERVTHAHLMPTLDHVAEAVLAKVHLSGDEAITTKFE